MTDKKEVYDGLKCGNCGYDGGGSHLKEKLEWQAKLHSASEISDETRLHRAWAFTIAAVLCSGICVLAFVNRPIVEQALPLNPEIVRMEKIALMYEKCTEVAKNVDNRSAALEACNTAFKTELDKK